MASPRWDSLREDIGGPFVGDPRAFAYFIPLAWLLSMVGSNPLAEPWTFAAQMLANAIAFASCYGLLLIIRMTIFRERHRRTIALSVVISAGLVLGASKVGITATLTSLLTGEWGEFAPVGVRILAAAVTGAWFLPVAAVILAVQSRYRTARDVVYAERLRTTEEISGWEPTDPTRVRLSKILDDARRAISELHDQPEALASHLTALLEKKIRPLSRDLWLGPGRKDRDSSAAELIRIVVSRHRYWPTLTVLALVLTSSPLIISTVGWMEGIGRLSVLGASAGLALVTLGRLPPGRDRAGALILFGASLTFASINELIAYLLFGIFGDFSPLLDIVLNSALFAGLALLLGALRVTRSELNSLLGELATILGEEYFASRIAREQIRARHRELAHIIHGRLQNQVLGVVLALSKNPEGVSAEELSREIELIDAVITSRDPLGRATNNGNLSEELAALVARWSGIIDVSVTPPVPEDVAGESVVVLIGLAEEGITNAVRHGLASTVTISIHNEDNDWVLSVSDDGVGPRLGLPGIGTLTLSKVAGESWSLLANPSGTGSVLTVRIESSRSHRGSIAPDPLGRAGLEPVTDGL